MAAKRPIGGTATAITVTTWLAKLVRPRTVATGVGLIASSISVFLPFAANRYSRCGECQLRPSKSMRIAIVGAGISGLGAAYLLARAHEVEIFERDPRPGGHVNTISHDGLQLDTGFIVFNERNYPQLVRLFSELGVRSQPSEMSFSVGCDRCSLEWSGRRPFAQPLNAASPRFLAFLVEVSAGCGRRRRALEDGSYGDGTLLDFITERGYSRPLPRPLPRPAHVGALVDGARARARVPGRHTPSASSTSTACSASAASTGERWREGAAPTLTALCERLRGRVHLGLGVARAASLARRRCPAHGGRARSGASTRSWSPRTPTRRCGCSATRATRSGASSARSDTRPTMPCSTPTGHCCRGGAPPGHPGTSRAGTAAFRTGGPTITYYLNRLQQLEAERDYCVTLNRSDEIAPESVIARMTLRASRLHPGEHRGPA